jgi:hypothetical protein
MSGLGTLSKKLAEEFGCTQGMQGLEKNMTRDTHQGIMTTLSHDHMTLTYVHLNPVLQVVLDSVILLRMFE